MFNNMYVGTLSSELCFINAEVRYIITG